MADQHDLDLRGKGDGKKRGLLRRIRDAVNSLREPCQTLRDKGQRLIEAKTGQEEGKNEQESAKAARIKADAINRVKEGEREDRRLALDRERMEREDRRALIKLENQRLAEVRQAYADALAAGVEPQDAMIIARELLGVSKLADIESMSRRIASATAKRLKPVKRAKDEERDEPNA